MDDEDAIDDAIEVVTAFYGVASEDVTSTRRTQPVHRARCVGMYLALKSGVDVEKIGRRFGGRDRTVVADFCRKIANEVSSDNRQARLVDSLQQACAEAAARRYCSRRES
jgi:chromosomal replication initiator protein